MEASNRRSCGVSFILVDTAIIVKERLNHTQCLTIQPPMLRHSQGQVPGYIPQQTGYYVTPTIGEYQSVVRNIRREEVVLARLRHTRVTHSYLLQGEEQPQCVGCDAPFTVRRFLLECGDFAPVRNNCFHVDNIHIDSIMTFLRQINFNKISLLFLKSCFVLHLYQTIIQIILCCILFS